MLPLIKYQISVIINHLLRWSVLLELLMMEQILALKRQQPHTHLAQVDSHELSVVPIFDVFYFRYQNLVSYFFLAEQSY